MDNTTTDKLDESIRSIASGKAGLSVIKKEVFREYVEFISEIVSVGSASFEQLSTTKGLVDKLKQVAPTGSYATYQSIVKGVRGHAGNKAIQFAAFTNTLNAYKVILEHVTSNLDKLFANSQITVVDTKLSHVMIMGMVKEAELLGKFSIYFINAMTTDLVKDLNAPKYRKVFIRDNLEEVIDIINKVYAKSGAFTVIKKITELRASGKDYKLVTSTLEPTTAMIMTDTNISADNTSIARKGIVQFNGIRFLGEWWNLLRHWWIEICAKDKDWMEAHVAILKLELENVPKDSPEYIKLTKIISTYDDRIIRLEQRVNNYYNESNDEKK